MLVAQKHRKRSLRWIFASILGFHEGYVLISWKSNSETVHFHRLTTRLTGRPRSPDVVAPLGVIQANDDMRRELEDSRK